MAALSTILGGSGSAPTTQRRETFVLTSSNASFPIPSWAQGGKGIVYVTGCGGGGGGGASNPGASGAQAFDHPIYIPSGSTTLAATIGSGGNGNASGPGTTGGATSIAVGGATPLSLGGGGGGLAAFDNPALGGIPSLFGRALDFALSAADTSAAVGSTVSDGANKAGRVAAFLRTLSPGIGGISTSGSFQQPALSSGGAPSIFGAAGVGYGSGGNTGNNAGRPGLLILTFVEVS